MKEISFEESKRIMIKILESIDKCCRENNINYSLCWGTMIGAIRHHGFIPWDDDIDIMMPREDYNRFLDVYNDPKYGVYSPKVNKNCIQIISKIYDKSTCVYLHNHINSLFGVWISIFPYDNAPDENIKPWEKKRTFLMNIYHLKTCKKLYRHRLKRRKILKQVTKFLLIPFSSSWIYRRIENCLTAFNGQQTKNVCIWYGGTFTWFRYFPKELFDEFIDVDFEDIKVKIIKGYDQYLKQTYGDYMKLPSESERVPKHNYKAYYVE